MTKTCAKCGKTGEFFKCKKSKDGFQSWCKACKSKQVSKYYKTNKGKAYKKELYDRDPGKAKRKALRNYRKHSLAYNMSRQIRRSLGTDKNGAKWEEVVGYSLDELKSHLEKQFQPGMTWDNYGKWHIDHIKPISSFNINGINSDDFKKCWSLNNLQPLWAKDNLQKGNQ